MPALADGRLAAKPKKKANRFPPSEMFVRWVSLALSLDQRLDFRVPLDGLAFDGFSTLVRQIPV